MSHVYTPEELEALVTKMRALGVLECNGVKLGPVPVTDSEESEESTQRSFTANLQQERQARLERRRLAFAASGGPEPRPDFVK